MEKTLSRMDQFAELLSQDIPVPAIAERMGMSRGAGYGMLARLRAKMGAQAC